MSSRMWFLSAYALFISLLFMKDYVGRVCQTPVHLPKWGLIQRGPSCCRFSSNCISRRFPTHPVHLQGPPPPY